MVFPGASRCNSRNGRLFSEMSHEAFPGQSVALDIENVTLSPAYRAAGHRASRMSSSLYAKVYATDMTVLLIQSSENCQQEYLPQGKPSLSSTIQRTSSGTSPSSVNPHVAFRLRKVVLQDVRPDG
jgi:hypothetical protein